ncbi:MAG: AMP-binding protein [Rubrivivax sp.]|nr:AMP-binding protein [Rubrivivax sp.]
MSGNPFSSFATAAPAAAAGSRAPQDGRSYVRGDASVPLRYTTLPALLADTVRRHGPRPAAVFREQGLRLSWYDLAARVDELAAALLSVGIVRGDRVGIWSPNRVEWLLTMLATARIGAILVNINPAYRSAELAHALTLVQVKALVMAPRFKGSDYLQILGPVRPAHLGLVVVLGPVPEALPEGCLGFDALRAMAGPAHRARLDELSRALEPDDAINIQFTSGTTGAPKGATLTHHNIVNNALAVAQAMRLTAADRLCIPVPLYHCFGMVLGVLACMATGAAMVFPGEAFDAEATLAAVHHERCTALHGVPTMFIAELDHPRFAEFDLSSLRTGIMAGAPCPVETMKRVVAQMHLREITIAYGMTETSPVSFQSGTDDPLEQRVSTVGRVLPHLEVKIVDDEGRIVPVGRRGELCTRGYSVMKGYWGDPARTAEAVRGGWMHTGDLATLDEQGWCRIVGRVKDMLIRGGENVFPREVEEFLHRHPKVQEAQVFGVPDARLGEEVACWIVLKPGQQAGADEIRAFCQGQIAHHKVPRHIRFVAELPMTVTGKPQKFRMREAMMLELGLRP